MELFYMVITAGC